MRLTKRLGLLAAAAAFTASTAAVAAPTFINILTGGTSGVYYPIGVALSQQYNKIDGAKTSVQATKASVENLNLLQAGRGELAFSLGDSVADAWNGVEDAGFKAPLKRLRAIAGTYNNYIQIVASEESGIKTLEDLKGKRISVGAPKSGTELNARAIFKAAGLDYKDMGRVEFLPYAESVELIKNRQLDDQADVRQPVVPGQRPLRRQGHQAGKRHQEPADSAAPGCRALLQGSRGSQVTQR